MATPLTDSILSSLAVAGFQRLRTTW